jgi:hypothetical protein
MLTLLYEMANRTGLNAVEVPFDVSDLMFFLI